MAVYIFDALWIFLVGFYKKVQLIDISECNSKEMNNEQSIIYQCRLIYTYVLIDFNIC